VRAGFLRILEFTARIKLKKDRVNVSSEERQGLKSPRRTNFRRVDAKLFSQETLRAQTDGRYSWREKHRFPWAIGSSKYEGRIRVESILTLASLGEIVYVDLKERYNH